MQNLKKGPRIENYNTPATLLCQGSFFIGRKPWPLSVVSAKQNKTKQNNSIHEICNEGSGRVYTFLNTVNVAVPENSISEKEPGN